MSDVPIQSSNPFRPGAGQRPIYLAGRNKEQEQFTSALDQSPLTQNLIITGLRGVGKTVLLETLKPIAQSKNWLWTGNDMSESTSLTEERLVKRIVVDLTTLLSPILIKTQEELPFGFDKAATKNSVPLDFNDLWKVYETTNGLTEDKLKAVLVYAIKLIEGTNIQGVVFAYDEAQNLADHAASKEFPLSVLLDVFSWIQRQQTKCKFLLLLTGLPTLFPKLNEARTYTERMFHVLQLERLDKVASREAIEKPLEINKSALRFSEAATNTIIQMSGGYPYFLQFICKEVFDAWIGRVANGLAPSVPSREILEKLDQDFFASRWVRATDRQQQFMQVISTLANCDEEFSVPEIVSASKNILRDKFSTSHAVQILQALADKGLVYKSKRGAYCFAVPLLAQYIKRQTWDPASLLAQSSSSGH